MTHSARVQCLDDELTEYAAGRLPLNRQWAWDRHLVTCQVCGHAVDQERRLRSALAGAPTMPGDLRTTLLALGSTMAADLPRTSTPPSPAPDPLRLLAPGAPPCHRSPLRATVIAAAAAGISAAAAWSLTMVPAPGTGRPALATVIPLVAATATPTRAATAAVSNGFSQGVVLTRTGQQAESTP